jgi:hypothetical protein
MRRSFCLGDRANAVDGATEASKRSLAPLSVGTIPCDRKTNRLSAPKWHCQPTRWECTEVLAIYLPLSDVGY